MTGGDADDADRGLDSQPWVTVLFTTLAWAPPSQDTSRQAAAATALEALRGTFAELVRRHGGLVNQVESGGMQAVFGLSALSEKDALGAVEAALDMRQAAATWKAGLSAQDAAALEARFGIHGGVTALREDAVVPGRVQLMGQLPAIAQHLSALAADGEILVSEETLGPFVYAYNTHAMGVSQFEGIDLAPRLRRVLGRLGPRSRYQAASTRGMARFAGRSAEMQTLRLALAEARAGQPGFLALSAPTGAGKTRLAEEFLREARSQACQVLRGECEAGLSSAPLQAFVDMLRRRWPVEPAGAAEATRAALRQMVAGVDPACSAHMPALLDLLGFAVDATHAPPEALGRTSAGTSARAALLALLAALAHTAPLVIFIDDWQWADDATREAASQLLSRVDMRVMVLVATRPTAGGDVSLAKVRTLQLAPLTDAETRQTIADLMPSSDPFVVEDVVRWSGGNPLYVEELCHYVVRHNGLPGLQSKHGPAWLETLTASRLNAVPGPMRQVLEAAAVIGVTQPLEALTHLAACPAEDSRLRALAAQDFLYPADEGGKFRFKHELIRQVVYAATSPEARKRLHRQMAEWLCPEGDAIAAVQHCEALAYHWAGAGEYAVAARCGDVAGDRAMANSSVDLAKAQYRAALDMLGHLPDTPERYQTWRSVARRYGLASVFDPAAADGQVFQRAFEQAQHHGDKPGAAYARYWAAYGLYALGHNRQALAHGRACLALASATGERRLALQAQAMLAQVHAAASEIPEAQALFGQTVPVISQMQAAGAPVGPGLSYLLACQGGMLGDLGLFDEAERCFERALATVPGLEHEVNGSVRCLRACVRLWAGRHEEALADALQAEQVGTRVRSLYLYAMGRALAGRARWCQDGGQAALKSMAEATGWLQAHGQRLFTSLNHGWLAEAAAAVGDTVKVRQQVGLALKRAREGDLLGLPMALRALAKVEAPGNGAAHASRHLALANRIGLRRGSPHEQRANEAMRRELQAWPGVKRGRTDRGA